MVRGRGSQRGPARARRPTSERRARRATSCPTGRPSEPRCRRQDGEERWAIHASARVGERRGDRCAGDDRGAAHRQSRVRAELAERDDRAGQRAHAGPGADPAGDRDHAAPQACARLVAGVPEDEDLAAAHPGAGAGVGASEPPARRAADRQEPAAHLGAGPVAGVALDEQLAAGHPRACVGADAAARRSGAAARGRAGVGPRPVTPRHRRVAARSDYEAPTTHPEPEAGDEVEVSFDAHVLFSGSGHVEQLADGDTVVAVAQLEALDRVAAEPGQPVGPQDLGVHGRDRRLAQRQRQRHSSSRRWKWCLPRLPP